MGLVVLSNIKQQQNMYGNISISQDLPGNELKFISPHSVLKHFNMSSNLSVFGTSYKLQVKNFGSSPTTKRTQVHYKLSRVK